jgi:biopolymer transport protein ExbB
MIGLFGTVYGMILAFQSIVVAGGNADPVLLAGGISTALTTTFWGLVVAIPALAGYGIIRNKIDELTTEATLTAQELVNQFRPKPRAKSPESARNAGEAPADDDTQ